MAMTKEEKALRRAIKALVRAEVADSWRGSSHPDEWDAIEAEVKEQRVRCAAAVKDVCDELAAARKGK